MVSGHPPVTLSVSLLPVLQHSIYVLLVRSVMGGTIDIWRGRIGCFSQPNKTRNTAQTLTINKNYVCLRVRIALFLLLAMTGVVGPNPGPGLRRGSTTNTRSAVTRLSAGFIRATGT